MKEEMKDRIKKYPFNPVYYQAHNDICKRRDTKRLYLGPLCIYLPHGRGAGTTTFCAIESLLAVEKSVSENQKPEPKKKIYFYHVAASQDSRKLCNVLVLVKTQNMMRSARDYFMWAIDHLGLIDKYKYNNKDCSFVRKGTNNRIKFVSVDSYMFDNRIAPFLEYDFIVIDNADCIEEKEYRKIFAMVPANEDKNRIILVSYNPRIQDDLIGRDFNKNKWNPNYKKYKSDYRTMPKDWIGKSFFKHANMVMKSNPKAYYEEFLGIKYKEPKKIVPHGTFPGKKKIAE